MGEFWCLQEGKGMQLLALLSLFFFFFSLLNNMIFKVPQDFLLRRTEKRTVTRDTISILNFGRQFAILDVPVSAISP